MKKKFSCLDKNEAQKLASMIFIKDGKETFITEILNVIDNEIVVLLKDKSAHSVLLKDNKEVESFVDFIQSVIEKQHKVEDTTILENQIEITKK
ncbi:MAG: hypothetical protein V3R12_04905 [Nitrosopumilaceae archaeon]|nr:MAG: hypothetical protein NPMRd3_200011 [Nitrosopumilales archaeon]